MTNISKIAETKTMHGASISGHGMDRRVEKRTPPGRWIAYGVAAALVAAFAWWLVDTLLGGRSLTVNAQRIVVSTATVGIFEDFVPLRGRLVPSSTVYLDAIEGGRVERVLVEDGALVAAGEPIAILSNTNLQLEVLGREAAVTEQL
ncbi:MAG: biotin/lipoyl-binding protein, partial [Gammaproteobacteria bacterium]|nr:biotin/lipoyl-binding protein [Gammaproteobacteria bacterium]